MDGRGAKGFWMSACLPACLPASQPASQPGRLKATNGSVAMMVMPNDSTPLSPHHIEAAMTKSHLLIRLHTQVGR